MSTDYYDILGIKKGATKAEVKKAFRQKAKQHHPDKGGDEAEFKKVNEAYETLSNDQKRAQYDQFGSGGPQFGGGGGGGAGGFGGGFSAEGFGGFEDILSGMFGGGRSSSRHRQSSNRGSDLEVDIHLSFEEAMKGVTKKMGAKRYEKCEKCSGDGGSEKKACGICGGQGYTVQQMQTPFGQMQQQVVCQNCQGEGAAFEKVCGSCRGEGRVEKKHQIEIEIPAGIDHGETLRLSGQGDMGRCKGPAGDLYVHVHVGPSRVFERQGNNIVTVLSVPILEAITGGEYEVETFWGKGKLKVPSGVEDGRVLRIKGKGVRRDGAVGDHLVVVRHVMPKKLSAKAKDLLEELKKLF